MNKTLVALIASGAMVTMAACSSTRTQRAPGEQVDDAALLTSVKSALAADPVTEAGEINVDVNRGVVKLAGYVDSPKEKQQAGDAKRSGTERAAIYRKLAEVPGLDHELLGNLALAEEHPAPASPPHRPPPPPLACPPVFSHAVSTRRNRNGADSTDR